MKVIRNRTSTEREKKLMFKSRSICILSCLETNNDVIVEFHRGKRKRISSMKILRFQIEYLLHHWTLSSSPWALFISFSLSYSILLIESYVGYLLVLLEMKNLFFFFLFDSNSITQVYTSQTNLNHRRDYLFYLTDVQINLVLFTEIIR